MTGYIVHCAPMSTEENALIDQMRLQAWAGNRGLLSILCPIYNTSICFKSLLRTDTLLEQTLLGQHKLFLDRLLYTYNSSLHYILKF